MGAIPKFVLTDKGSAKIVALAAEYAIPCRMGNPRKSGFSAGLEAYGNIDLILSINYLFLIDNAIIGIPRYGCVNLHGSLLPKYRGRAPHVWAIINNEQKTGVTAHYIDAGCDTGRVLVQREVLIEPWNTGGDLLKTFTELYPKIAVNILEMFDNAGVPPEGKEQDEANATYFGKRTAQDGHIEWHWWRERIRNWVRAQAHPYPGAFCYYRGVRVIVDRVEFSDTGFHSDLTNGTILIGGSHPIVKTCNGAIRFAELRNEIEFKKGEVLI